MGGKYGLIGEKLGHSFSPAIHKRLGEYEYRLIELSPEQLPVFLSEDGFDGLNVTIPYKKAVIPFCKELTHQARRIGSVNTVVRQRDGSLLGHNTDYDGFAYLLRSAKAQLAGKKVLVLGSGGASLTVHTVLSDLGAGEIVAISRSGGNNYNNLHRHVDAKIIVNTTPVGMYPHTGVTPVELSCFPKLEGVYDLIYNPAKTKLLLEAEKLGLQWANGLGMLVAQAKAAAQMFTGQTIDDERVAQITREIAAATQNLLLVGMPGCGKSTVGGALAQRLGRELVDTDELVEQTAGCTIPVLFKRQGEAAFRQLEHKILCQVANRSGLIIATGGGIVTRPENMDYMRQNSTIIFLQRDVEQLPIQGRPISQRENLHQLYQQRLPLYRGVADLEVENTQVELAVSEIIRRLSL